MNGQANNNNHVTENDLEHCKDSVSKEMLLMEQKILNRVLLLEQAIKMLNGTVAKLITRPEFEPVKMITFGLAGGVLIAALGAVMGRVLGW